MSAPQAPLNSPPFPEMIWSDCDWWEGRIRLPAWAGFLSRGGGYGTSDSEAELDGSARLVVTPNAPDTSTIPSQAQAKAFVYQIEHGREVVESVLRSLVPYHEGLRPRWAEYFEPEVLQRIMPAIAAPEDFRRLLGLHCLHVHPWMRDGFSYVGLEFGCTWDGEHGFGVMLHGARVVDIGSAETSFAWEPDEAE